MGFNFRKSIKMGPVRVNLSKSGVGYSVGGKGMRVTKKAGGGTRTTVGIPGTGISYSSDSKKKVASAKKPSSISRNSKPVTETTRVGFTEKNWPKTIVLTILTFAVVGVVTFIAAFLCYAFLSLFIENFGLTIGARFLVFGIPVIFAVLSALIMFLSTKPKSDKQAEVLPREELMQTVIPPIQNYDVHAEVLPVEEIKQSATPQKSEFQIRLEEMQQQFEDELTAIPMAEIGLSDPAPRQLLKNLPEYSFSNITKKTRLDSIFPLVFLDVETTGFAPSKCEILEVSAIKFESGMTPVAAFTTLCKPNKPIPEEASAVNHITDDMVSDAPAFSQIAPALTDFLAGCHVAGHNLDFDLRFIFAHGAKIPEKVRFYDTLDLAQLTIPKSAVDNYKLDRLCFYYGVWRNNSHRSLSDCYATSKIFTHLVSDKTGRQLDANAEIESEKDAE